MSAFVLRDVTFNSLVAHFETRHIHGDGTPDAVRVLLVRPTRDEGVKALMLALWAMNVSSVKQRYPRAREMWECDAPEYRSVPTPTNVQALKTLQCLLYQSCEGDVDKSDLYKALSAYVRDLALEIVQALPEYDQAPWG